MSHIDEDMEWNPAEHHPFLTQPYRGRQQFLEGAVATVAAELDGFRFDIQQVLACGEVAVSQLRYRGTVKNTGRSLDRGLGPSLTVSVTGPDADDGLSLDGHPSPTAAPQLASPARTTAGMSVAAVV